MIVGVGEDGHAGLPDASRQALARAEVVMGPPRHLALVPGGAQRVEWPVPFADGIPQLLALRGRRVVVLASGDPFWFGAGSVLAKVLPPGEWRAIPGVSVLALACARLGWAAEGVLAMGLHAAPVQRLRPHLAPGLRAVVTLRDGEAVGALAAYLAGEGFGESVLHVMEALGGPRERVRSVQAGVYALADVAHPVAVALEVAGSGGVMGRASGRADEWFDHDGQITKRPVRALALSALAPRSGELLWDIGAGSGSIGIEWMLAHPACRAIGFEGDPERAARARANGARLGVALEVVEGRAPGVLAGQARPDAVFIGGGLSRDVVAALPAGVRLVAHAVTLESEALLAQLQAERGGTLLRIELAEAAPLGRLRGWKAAYPVVQWSVTL